MVEAVEVFAAEEDREPFYIELACDFPRKGIGQGDVLDVEVCPVEFVFGLGQTVCACISCGLFIQSGIICIGIFSRPVVQLRLEDGGIGISERPEQVAVIPHVPLADSLENEREADSFPAESAGDTVLIVPPPVTDDLAVTGVVKGIVPAVDQSVIVEILVKYVTRLGSVALDSRNAREKVS